MKRGSRPAPHPAKFDHASVPLRQPRGRRSPKWPVFTRTFAVFCKDPPEGVGAEEGGTETHHGDEHAEEVGLEGGDLRPDGGAPPRATNQARPSADPEQPGQVIHLVQVADPADGADEEEGPPRQVRSSKRPPHRQPEREEDWEGKCLVPDQVEEVRPGRCVARSPQAGRGLTQGIRTSRQVVARTRADTLARRRTSTAIPVCPQESLLDGAMSRSLSPRRSGPARVRPGRGCRSPPAAEGPGCAIWKYPNGPWPGKPLLPEVEVDAVPERQRGVVVLQFVQGFARCRASSHVPCKRAGGARRSRIAALPERRLSRGRREGSGTMSGFRSSRRRVHR